MTSISKVLSILIVMSMCLPCFAVESMSKNGKAGVWMSEEEFDKVLADKEELTFLKNEKVPALQLEIEKFKILVSQKDSEIKILDDTIVKSKELYEASIKLHNAEVDKLQLRIEKFDKWYRSPAFALISGVFVGGLLAVGLEFGMDEAKR